MVNLGVLWLYYEPDAASPWLIENGIDAEVRKRRGYERHPGQERARAPHQRGSRDSESTDRRLGNLFSLRWKSDSQFPGARALQALAATNKSLVNTAS